MQMFGFGTLLRLVNVPESLSNREVSFISFRRFIFNCILVLAGCFSRLVCKRNIEGLGDKEALNILPEDLGDKISFPRSRLCTFKMLLLGNSFIYY